jgi:micrococcal nuclease
MTLTAPRLRWGVALVVMMTLGGSAVSATAPPLPPDDPWLVTDVIDGDTLDVARGTRSMTVRLIGINAPESDECWADEATALLVRLVGSGPVWLSVDTSVFDQFGRALRYVVDADGNDVGGLLVEQGAAIARSYPPDTANDERYALLQEAARLDGRGLWDAEACGAADPTVAVDIEVHPDAAGDDNANLNDEWVRFTNTASSPLDLDGWTVRDESATHRYKFADLVVPATGAVTLHTGCGTDTPTERFWCSVDSAVWNNGGDTVFLLDRVGNIVTSLGY